MSQDTTVRPQLDDFTIFRMAGDGYSGNMSYNTITKTFTLLKGTMIKKCENPARTFSAIPELIEVLRVTPLESSGNDESFYIGNEIKYLTPEHAASIVCGKLMSGIKWKTDNGETIKSFSIQSDNTKLTIENISPEDLRFEEQVENEKRLVREVADHKKRFDVSDPFFNNRYRENAQKLEIMKLWKFASSDVIMQPEKADWACANLNILRGEMKCCWVERPLRRKHLGDICFDKQNDEIRRNKEVYEYDGLMYSGMMRDEAEFLFSVIILGLDNMKTVLHPLISREQQNYLQELEVSKLRGKRKRDDIRIPVIDVIDTGNDENFILILEGKKVTKQEFLTNL